MNDLVSEYQQYQDATAEGEWNDGWESDDIHVCWIVEEGEGVEGEEEERA